MATPPKSRSAAGRPDQRTRRFAARLAAVQAIFQHFSVGTPKARLLHEFHDHRLGETIEEVVYPPADQGFFDDVVAGVLARRDELDTLIAGYLANGWTLARLDRLMHAILSAGAYELVARADVPKGAVVNEYVDVARSFYGAQETGFVNALLDRMGGEVRAPEMRPPDTRADA